MEKKEKEIELQTMKNSRPEAKTQEKTPDDTIAVRYMKLVAEVYQDIAELKNGNEKKGLVAYNFNSQDSNGKHGLYLFNKSSAIRKLVVFLATENLEDIKMHGKVHDRPKTLLQVALQPQMARTYFNKDKDSGVWIQDLESAKQYKSPKSIKAGFDQSNSRVYYNKDDVFNDDSGSSTKATQTVSKLLTGIVEAVKSVTEKNKDIKKSLTNEDGLAKDLVDVDEPTKKNIQIVLKQCLEKKDPENKTKISFVFKIQAAWKSFLAFLGVRTPIVKQNKIIPPETKEGVDVLSNFLKDASENNNAKTKQHNVK
ncbi:MAG: hypothetical protein IJU86_00015 [Firmicutes bacterium]|nr:hypothetical protein [Bacillota bacterium]